MNFVTKFYLRWILLLVSATKLCRKWVPVRERDYAVLQGCPDCGSLAKFGSLNKFSGSLISLENCIEFGSSDGKYGLNTDHIFVIWELYWTYTITVVNHTNVIQIQYRIFNFVSKWLTHLEITHILDLRLIFRKFPLKF